ncbi:hypothetical protein PMG11_11123 [Penicillium brasilianum]|uniref:Major facilitator superfamily (MFS) profile domain-containing protein n=1 Tax=Penicillium brasilianum TaxID=104259 RepID=A0A0F7U191_PENBI|nr:hypothetical protein PMG11_11123 [Penicillium brasilianum]
MNLSTHKSPSQPDCVETGTGDTSVTFNPDILKRFKFKTDFILLPILSFAYLLNSLDRSNLSNAYTAGLSADLGLTGNQYNQILTYYQIPFIVLGPVTTMLTKKLGARWTIPGMLLIFGAASLASGFVKDFESMVICRVFVGAFEAGFLASVLYYLSIWYTRKELASRIGIFYAALTASSAFGGLFAYGMFQIKNDMYFRWSYLFFLEGGLTMAWAIFMFFVLPSDTQRAWFLTQAEKEVARLRLEQDSVTTLNAKFSWRESLSEFSTPHGYIRICLSFVGGTILTSNANFLVIVVERLGYDVVKTNLYTVAPALVGAVFLIAFCKSSDYFRERGFHQSASSVFSLVGYILLATISSSNIHILYFAMFLCTMGAYPSTPIGAAWTIANIPNLNARALTSGLFVSFGNCGGLLSSNVYLAREAPRYITSLTVNIIMSSILVVASSAYTLWMRWENRRRDQRNGPGNLSTEGITSSCDPRFRFET